MKYPSCLYAGFNIVWLVLITIASIEIGTHFENFN